MRVNLTPSSEQVRQEPAGYEEQKFDNYDEASLIRMARDLLPFAKAMIREGNSQSDILGAELPRMEGGAAQRGFSLQFE